VPHSSATHREIGRPEGPDTYAEPKHETWGQTGGRGDGASYFSALRRGPLVQLAVDAGCRAIVLAEGMKASWAPLQQREL